MSLARTRHWDHEIAVQSELVFLPPLHWEGIILLRGENQEVYDFINLINIFMVFVGFKVKWDMVQSIVYTSVLLNIRGH